MVIEGPMNFIAIWFWTIVLSRTAWAARPAWICVDIFSNGFLSDCVAYESKKPYGQDYNAAAHLRSEHFNPKFKTHRSNIEPEERRSGKGEGTDTLQ